MSLSIIHDTWLGHATRLLTGSKFLQWPETSRPESYLSAPPVSKGIDNNDNVPPSDSSDLPESDEKAQDRAEVITIDWLEDDEANPHNWSSAKKAWAFAQICLLTTSVYVGAAIYTAGLTGVQEQFHVSAVAALLGLTVFIIGYGVGPMVLAPISELPAVGRTPVYIGTLIVFVAFQPAIVYAKNFGMLLAFRFLTGFFGSPALALGGATAADLYAPPYLSYAMSLWGAAAAFGPVLGPVCAGYAAQIKSWKWTIWELMWLSGFCLVVLVMFLPETLEANILHRRAKRVQAALRKRDASQVVVKSRPDIEAEKVSGAQQGKEILTQVFLISFFEPLVLVLNLYIALVYALLYLWFESFPLVFVGIYHFNGGELGLAFIGILVGTLISLAMYFAYVRMRLEPLYADPSKAHKLKPELSMEVACFGCFFIPISMFIFAWSSRPSVHWIVPIIGTSLFPVGIFSLFMAVLGYLAAAYPNYIASVLGGNDLMRAGFGAGFPLFADAMFHKLGIDWGNTLLALLAAVFIPIPFILIKHGASIRKRSKKATQDETDIDTDVGPGGPSLKPSSSRLSSNSRRRFSKDESRV